jgi:hypothetical protein
VYESRIERIGGPSRLEDPLICHLCAVYERRIDEDPLICHLCAVYERRIDGYERRIDGRIDGV